MAWCLLRREPISAVTLPQARNCTIRRLAVGVSPAALTPHASCIARRCWPTAWLAVGGFDSNFDVSPSAELYNAPAPSPTPTATPGVTPRPRPTPHIRPTPP